MPRYFRDCPVGSLQHLIHRFVNREFRLDDPARRSWLRRMARARDRTDWEFLSYALMTSHFHVGCIAGLAPAESWMRSVHSGMATALNRRQNRLGPVFSDRPKSIGMDAEKAALLVAYIHNNPVRAGLVRDPADSTWTSHRAFIGDVVAPRWLNVERALSLCGFDSSPAGRANFHSFVCSRSGAPRDPLLSGDRIDELRKAARAFIGPSTEVSYAVPPSDPARFAEYRLWNPHVGPAFVTWRGSVEELLSEAAAETRCLVDELQSRSRTARLVWARRLFVRAGVTLGCKVGELAAALGRSGQLVALLLHAKRPDEERLQAAAMILCRRLLTKCE